MCGGGGAQGVNGRTPFAGGPYDRMYKNGPGMGHHMLRSLGFPESRCPAFSLVAQTRQ